MAYVSVEDFCEKAGAFAAMSRQEEIEYARRMKDGDDSARTRLVQSYLPVVAGHVKRVNPQVRQLGLVLYCVQALERAVDSFDFLQDSEPFVHRLSWSLRQATARYIAR